MKIIPIVIKHKPKTEVNLDEFLEKNQKMLDKASIMCYTKVIK